MKKYHEISDIYFTDDTLRIRIDGKNHEFKISEISERLESASKAERNRFELSPSGYGIHWPQIDEDLSINSLLGIKHQPKKIKETTKV